MNYNSYMNTILRIIKFQEKILRVHYVLLDEKKLAQNESRFNIVLQR